MRYIMRQSLVSFRIEAVERGGPMLPGLARLGDLLQNPGGKHLLAEVALIERAIQNRLIDLLQFAQGEGWRQQLEADGGVFQLAAQPLASIVQNFVVIERQRRMLVRREPLRIGGVVARPRVKLVGP